MAGGCPSAALLEEIGRCDEATREAYTDGVRRIIDAFARLLDTGDAHDATERAIGLVTLLTASLQLARAVTGRDLADRVLADRVLTAAYANAMIVATGRLNSSTSTEKDSG